MNRVAAAVRALGRDERGASAVEYAIVAGSIAVVIAATVMATGGLLKGMYQMASDAFNN